MADPRSAFIDAALWHGSLDEAQAILTAHPEIAASDIYTAAVLGDDAAVRRFLALQPGAATATGGPRGWDALTYLCFSKYLRLEPARSPAFVRAATALLDAGAQANTGFFEMDHQPRPEWESALYGAAGVAHHAGLTRLLLEHGADPNDEEVPYHTPETYDNAALEVLVESGRLTDESLNIMLLRKADWHDREGTRYLLEHGANPNAMTRWGVTALHQALRRDNALANIALLLEHGADPTLATARGDATGVSVAARRGRGDVLQLFEQRGIPFALAGADQLIAACARGDAAGVQAIAQREPGLVREVVARGGALLAVFAGNGNTAGVQLLLDLGVPVDAPYDEGDGYFGVATRSSALHVAAWRAHPGTVKLLLDRGAAVNAQDDAGRTPLILAVRACVDSYWTERRSPDSVAALLAAGASPRGVSLPCGYAEVDALMGHGA